MNPSNVRFPITSYTTLRHMKLYPTFGALTRALELFQCKARRFEYGKIFTTRCVGFDNVKQVGSFGSILFASIRAIELKLITNVTIGNIYARSGNVAVYLGEGTMATDQAMDYLMQIEEGGISQIPSGRVDLILEGFQDITSRPWFQRVWILQDAFHARAAVLHCSSRSVSSKAIIHAPEVLPDKIDPLSQQVLDLLPRSRRVDRPAPKFQLHDFLQRFQHAKATDPRDKIYALLGTVDNGYSKSVISPDYSISQKDLMRAVLAHLCFWEPSSIPEPPYDTIDEFLSSLDPIDDDTLENIFESSLEIDLASLLRHGSHYIRIDRSLVAAASRNRTKGGEMVETLLGAFGLQRDASP